MALEALEHFTITCADLARTRDFYRDVLGLAEGYRPNFNFAGYWLYSGEIPVVHLTDDKGAIPENRTGARGEANTGGADKSSILADGMESLLGAIYIEHGITVAREAILRLFGALLDAAPTLGAGLDWKTSLQELTAARGLGAPSYVVSSTGPDHDKEFTAVVVVMDTEYGSGVGRSKKEAEQKAAAQTWKALEVMDTAGKTSV